MLNKDLLYKSAMNTFGINLTNELKKVARREAEAAEEIQIKHNYISASLNAQ